MFPGYFIFEKGKGKVISPLYLAVLIGTLAPAFDDLLAFVFGSKFAHHSLFHSMFGPLIVFLSFLVISKRKVAWFAAAGNMAHILFNFTFDRITPFFPLSFREWGLGDMIGVNTYWIKAICYPFILFVFIFSVIRYYYDLGRR
jgi:hypothetical protein